MDEDKGPGRGKGPQTAAGVQKLQAAKVANIESFLTEQYPGEFTAVEPTGNEDDE